MKLFSIRVLCSLVVFLAAVVVQAQTLRVNDIRVEGLQRVSAGSVFSALPIRVGDNITQEDIQNATRELFKLGFFTDVDIQQDGEVLVLILKERPAINKIQLEGNKAIKSENLMESLKKNNLSEGQIFQRATLEAIAQSLQREYVAQGRYGATVNIETEDLPRNQIKIKVKVNEGAVSRIKQINIVGNTVFSDEKLTELFELRSSGLWSWVSGDDKYSKEKMKGDLERLESYYMDRGYLAFKVDSSQISLSPDKTKIFITVNISEGNIYQIASVGLAGDPVVDPKVLTELFLTQPNQTFSQVLMTTTSELLTQRLGNEGYTFAKVEGMPERNEADKTVKITYVIDPGKRAYVNRINFKGNTKTIDEVLRREMRQMEGGSASTAQIDSSKVQLERLGFFKEVKVENKEVPGSSDKVDVNYTVEEAPSGSMNLSVGYAQYSGLLFQAGITQTNWFGTGKQVGFNFSHSKYQTAYSLNYNDPYFTPDGISRGFGLFYQHSDWGQLNLTPYSTNTMGGKLTFGYPISEIERIGLDFGLRRLEVVTTDYSSQEMTRTPQWFVNSFYPNGGVKTSNGIITHYITLDDMKDAQTRAKNGVDYLAGTYTLHQITEDVLSEKGFLDNYGRKFDDASISLYWMKSTLNKGVLPDRGASQRLSAEVTLPGGDLRYYKLDYFTQYFKPLNDTFTFKLRGRVGFADTYGVTKRLPFFENFYGGGFGSVRGFQRNSLGPRSTVQRSALVAYSAWDDSNGNGKGGFELDEDNQPLNLEREQTNQVAVLCTAAGAGKCNNLNKLITYNTGNVGDYGKYRGAYGGNAIVEAGAEVLFKLPFIKDQRSVQSSFFLDMGNVFDTHCGLDQRNCYDINANKIKAAVGIGLTWISSFGPMTFSLAEPISKEDPYDRREIFQFSLGQTF